MSRAFYNDYQRVPVLHYRRNSAHSFRESEREREREREGGGGRRAPSLKLANGRLAAQSVEEIRSPRLVGHQDESIKISIENTNTCTDSLVTALDDETLLLTEETMFAPAAGKVHFGGDELSLYGTPKEEPGPAPMGNHPGLPADSGKQSFIKNQLQALFQPTDNKLAMKLFGSKKALMKERIRQKAAGHWVIHPCSSFSFLATGERFQYLHYNFRIGASTAGKIVAETCAVLWDVLSPIYLMNEPTPEKWIKIAERFEELWQFPNCCGAIDGKHIRVESPWNCGSAFYNYKNFHSIVLQAVADAEGNFVVVDVGESGRNSDGGVFVTSSFGQMFNEQKLNLPLPRKLYPNSSPKRDVQFPYVFLGDEAYGLTKHLMKPFTRSFVMSKERKIYNYRQSRARRAVECAFGMMVKKFRVLETAMLVHIDVVKNITLACCVLHNTIRKREGKMFEVYEEIMNLEDTDHEQILVRSRASKAAYATRNNFVDYFMSSHGSVPWQETLAHCN